MKERSTADKWISQGIIARHKYINPIFKFLWAIAKKGWGLIGVLFFFALGLIVYKSIWNKTKYE